MLSVDQVVRVQATIAPTGLLRRDFGRTLFITSDTSLPINERVRSYSSLSGMAEDFAVGSEPYEAGSIYFQQVPYPKNFMVGRWAKTVEDALLYGGTHGALAAFQAIADGSLNIDVGLTADYDTNPVDTYQITGLDFSADASLAEVAETLQVALLTAFGGNGFDIVSVTYNATEARFEIAITADDPNTIVSLSYASAGGTGTDVSGLFGFTEALAAFKSSSTVVETIEDALTAIEAKDASFYFVTADTGINDTADSELISEWVAARIYMYCADSADLATLTGADSVFKRLSDLEPSRTIGTWSRTEDYKGVSVAGRLSSVNFNAANALITLKFKELPGTVADTDLSQTQAEQLAALAVNFYSERSGVKMYEEGYTFDKDVWADVRFGLDWLVNAAQVEVFNLLKSSPSRVPQTEEGMSAIKDALTLVCRQAVNNGLIAGGTLSPALTLDVKQSTGNSNFDGELSSGFLIYADPISTLSQADRAARKAPPVKIWLKGSGAIHFVDVIITFEN